MKLFDNFFKKNYFSIILSGTLLMGTVEMRSQIWEPVGNAAGITESTTSFVHLASDKDNNYYTSFYDLASTKASIMKYNGSVWQHLGEQGIGGAGVTYNSLSIDANGIVYYTTRSASPDPITWASPMEVRRFVGDAWERLPNPSTLNANVQASCIIPSTNQIIVSYMASNGIVMKYNGSTWEQVGATNFGQGSTFTFLDMVVDKKDTAYVSFVNKGYVHVYKNSITASSSEAWIPVGDNANIAAASGSDNFGSSIAIDKNDNLFLAYVSTESEGRKINVKKFNGTNWSFVGNENFSIGRANSINLAVNTEGVPYVSISNYEDVDFNKNYVMAYDPASNLWAQIGTGYISEGAASYNDLTFDAQGNLVLAFQDGGLNKLSVKKLTLSHVAPDSVFITTDNNAAAAITTDNGTLQLRATVKPNNANQNVKWSIISGANKATISENGLVTATTSDGIVTVKAEAADNASIFATLDVTLTNQNSDVAAEKVTVTTINNEKPNILTIGGTLKLIAHVFPAEADSIFNWTIASGDGVISIDQNGLVTSLADGYATVRATQRENSNVYGEIKIMVIGNGCFQRNETIGYGNAIDITEGSTSKGADDFVVEKGASFKPKRLTLSVWSADTAVFTKFNINVLRDNDGKPGDQLMSIKNIVPTEQRIVKENPLIGDLFEVDLDIPDNIVFTGGNYWLNPEGTTAGGSIIYWDLTIDGNVGNSFYHNTDGTGWVLVGTGGGLNGAFTLYGSCGSITHDVKISSVSPTLPRITPVYQAKGIFNVQVENNGLDAEEATVTIKNGETALASSTVSLAINEVKTLPISVDLSSFAPGSILSLVTEIGISNDENLTNNTFTTIRQVSDSTFVQDIVDTGFKDGLGNNEGIISFGPVFTLAKTDVLTSVNLAFKPREDKQNDEFGFAVYKVSNGNKVEDPIIEELFVRGIGGSSVTFMLPETVLEPGDYYFALKQLLSSNNIAIAYDSDPDGFYMYHFANDLSKITGYGSLHIRPNFAKKGYNSINNVSVGKNISLYPNPVTDKFTIESVDNIEKISIYNTLGVKVYAANVNATKQSIEVNNLKSGVYVAVISTKKGDTSLKFVVK
ncbi:MAG: Ig-like domain-containing protein [Dysgonomonas sp.]